MHTLIFTVLIILLGSVGTVLADCSAADDRFVIHENSTVTDTRSGLMWKRCVQGKTTQDCSSGTADVFNRADGMNSARAEVFGGYDDWRLPKIEELESIVAICAVGPMINRVAFPNSDPVVIHSVSGGLDYGTKTRAVDFGDGSSLIEDDNLTRQVRVVRTVN
jgi:hypothetical protein